MEAETSGSPSYVSDSQLQMWPPGGAVPQFSEGYSSHLMSYAFTLWHGNGLLSTFRSAGGRSSALRRQLFRLIPAIKRRSPALYHLIAQSLQKPNDPNPLSACHCFCDGVRLPPSLPPSLGSRPVQRELAQQLKGQKKKKGQREMLAQKTRFQINHGANVIGDLPTAGRSLLILTRAAVLSSGANFEQPGSSFSPSFNSSSSPFVSDP